MKQLNLVLVTLISILSSTAFCQDMIYLKSGDSLACKITKVDSEKVYLNKIINERDVQTYVYRENIASYKYNAIQRQKIDVHFYAYVTPLSFLVLGPTATGELTIGRVGFLSGYRNLRLGLLNQKLVYSDLDLQYSSYTIPFSLRIYKKTDKDSFWGLYTEFGKANYKSGESQDDVRLIAFEYGTRLNEEGIGSFEGSFSFGYISYKSDGIISEINSVYLAINIRIGIGL